MSRMLRFECEIPDEVFDERFPEDAFLKILREEAIIKLFTAERISSGYAATLLSMTRRDFLELIQQQGLSLTQYTETDFQADLDTLHLLDSGHSDSASAS